MKKVISILLALALVLSFASCSAFEINEEKDNEAVIAKVGDTEYLKKEFNDYKKFLNVVYAMNDSAVSDDKDSQEYFKQSSYEEYIYLLLAQKECEAKAMEVDNAEVDKAVDELITDLKEKYPSEGELNDLVERNGIADMDAFKVLAKDCLTLSEYGNMYMGEDFDKSYVADAEIFTVNGEAVNRATLTHYVILEILNSYLTTGQPAQTQEQFDELYAKASRQIADDMAVVAYAKENNITVTDEEIKTAMESVNQVLEVNKEQIVQMRDSYYVSEEDIDSAMDLMGKAAALGKKINDMLAEEFKPSEDKLKAYYDENISKYDESTISSYHILTEDEAYAKELTNKAGTTKESYMKLYDSLEGDEKIVQKSDLGEGKKSTYVKEFGDPVFEMEVGEVKGNIKSEFGYHLVYVYDKKVVPAKAFEELKETVIADYIAQNNQSDITAKYDEITDGFEIESDKLSYSDPASVDISKYLKDKYKIELFEKDALR